MTKIAMLPPQMMQSATHVPTGIYAMCACTMCLHSHLWQYSQSIFVPVPLIGWISDTLSQGYTDLQSLVKCLDDRGIVLVFCSSFMERVATIGTKRQSCVTC